MEKEVKVTSKGKGDRRFTLGTVGARTEPKFPHGDVSLFKFSEGERYTLYLTEDELYDLADAIEALLDYIEDEKER